MDPCKDLAFADINNMHPSEDRLTDVLLLAKVKGCTIQNSFIISQCNVFFINIPIIISLNTQSN